MKEKGFTLIELLGVIIILALLMILTFPSIINSIKSSSEKNDSLVLDLIYSATENFIKDNRNSYPSINDNSYCITLTDLIEHGNLKGPIKLNNEDVTNKKSVQVTYSDKFNYELKDSSSCVENRIIEPATESNKTLAGTVPQGNFTLGDEYIINVDGNNKYHFYVLSTEGNKVNLIMSNNICSDGTLATSTNTCLVSWASNVDYNDDTNYGSSGKSDKGPVTAINYLYEATKNWKNIKNIQMDYIDEGNPNLYGYGYGTIKTIENTTTMTMKDGTVTATYANLKARMPKKSEIEGTGCTSSNESCPAWMVNGLSTSEYYSNETKEDISNIGGYWSLSSYPSYSTHAGIVYYNGNEYGSTVSQSSTNGLRPVITVLKSNLS